MGTSYFFHYAAVVLSKCEESEQARTRTRTTRSEDLPRVEIVDLTRAQRDLLPSLPIHLLERLGLLLQPVGRLDELFRRLIALEHGLARPALLLEPRKLVLDCAQPRTEYVLVLRGLALLHQFLILLGELLFCFLDLTRLTLLLVLRHRILVQV